MRGPLRSACRAQALLVGCPVAPAHPGRSLGARPRVDDLRVQPAVAVDVGHVGLERTVAVLVVVGLVDQTVAVVVVADEVRASVVVHVRDDVDAAVGATDHCVLVPVPVTVDVDVRVVARRRRWRRRGEPAGGIPRLRQVASQQPALGADPAHRRADVAGNVAHPRLCRGTHAADSGLAETELGPVAEPHLARPTEAGLARVPRTLADALADRARVEPLAVAAEAAAATRAAVGRRPETGAARQGRQQSEQARLAGALLHMAIAARTGVELRVQQLDLVGREPVAGQRLGRVRGQGRPEPGIGHEPLQHRVKVTHRIPPPVSPALALVPAAAAAGTCRTARRPRPRALPPACGLRSGAPQGGTARTWRGPHTARARRTGTPHAPPWRKTNTTHYALPAVAVATATLQTSRPTVNGWLKVGGFPAASVALTITVIVPPW